MEAPLHRSLVPLPVSSSWRQQQQDAIGAAAALQQQQPPPMMLAPGREQCPRCASRDTKFCYYNNYNTAQPRHFCRACRRYWTLGGSLRNVPVGGSTRKRAARCPRARAAAHYATTFNGAAGASSSSSRPVVAPALQNVGLLSSLLLGSAPLLEGLGLGHGQPAFGSTGAGDLAQLSFGATTPLPWRSATVPEETPWKSGAALFPPPDTALWQELAAVTMAGEELHRGASPLLL